MRHVASKFIPRLLSVDQKQQPPDVCLDLKENAAMRLKEWRFQMVEEIQAELQAFLNTL
jgi:hypothetical protein